MDAAVAVLLRFFRVAAMLGAPLLIVSACGGGSSSSAASSDTPPTAEILFPGFGDSFSAGETVTFSASAEAADGSALTGDRLVWSTPALGAFGTGNQAETDQLTPGQHSILLTATDSSDVSTSVAVVVIVLSASAARDPRFGERNPYGGRLARLPVKLDDELVLIGQTAAGEMQMGLLDTPVSGFTGGETSEPLAPVITSSREAYVPLAADAGRTLDSALHQIALLGRPIGVSSDELLLELTGYADQDEVAIAARSFSGVASGPVAVLVADLDAFDEISGGLAIEAPTSEASRYHDEVAVAHAAVVAGQHRVRVHVLSFETLDYPENENAEAPPPTSALSALTSQPLLPGSRIVLRHGDSFLNRAGPHLLVAYLNTDRRIVIDLFEYRRIRDDTDTGHPDTDERSLERLDLVADDSGRQALLVSPELPEDAALAHGWDVVASQGGPLGAHSQLTNRDVAFVVWQQGGNYEKRAWHLQSMDGFANPVQIGSSAGSLGSFGEADGTRTALDILPDSSIQLAIGRVSENNDIDRCETMGLLVRADTNRGPVVQVMYGRLGDPFIGSGGELGLIFEEPAWPSLPRLRGTAETDSRSPATLVAGGFVSIRDGLVDHRWHGGWSEGETARDCSNTNTRPFLGQMPSFYVADPAADTLDSVTLSLGRTSGHGSTISHPLGISPSTAPLLVAADVNGDAGYYQSRRCIRHPDSSSSDECRTIFLGDATMHYVVSEIETQSVILQQPPKHVDYLRALGGIVDVSMRETYYAEFSQTDFIGGNISQKAKTDWTTGTTTGGGVGIPKPLGKDFSNVAEISVETEVQLVTEDFQAMETNVSLRQVSGAVDDDVVWSKLQTVDYWRFPAQGGRPEGRPDGATVLDEDNAYIDVAIPSTQMTMVGPGTLNDHYQPKHQVGNILSYPTFSGEVDTIADLFNFLGNYVPSGDDARRQCQSTEGILGIDPYGCIIRVGEELRRVSSVSPIDNYVAGRFESNTRTVDVAEVLQVGGTSYSAELRFDETVRQGETITFTESISGSFDFNAPISIPVKGVPFQVGTLEGGIRSGLDIENISTSENTMGSNTSISLHLPSSIPMERSYRIRPAFGFSPAGTLKVAYQVSTDGAASTFWEEHYSAPDPALNLPHRIVRTPDGYQLGTDNTRNRLQGFYVRDGAGMSATQAETEVGRAFVGVPSDGKPVQLEVRVYNLSLGSAVSNLAVRFEAQAYAGGQSIGEPALIGETTVDYLPHRGQYSDLPNGHITRARVLWDTTGFGDPMGQALRTYKIWVTLDPDNAIPNEVHNLQDRYNDPLRSSTGEPIDEGLEKGQNNRGWFQVRIAPPVEESDDGMHVAMHSTDTRHGIAIRPQSDRQTPVLQLSHVDQPDQIGYIIAERHETVQLRIDIDVPETHRGQARLRVFDGDPRTDGQMVLSRTLMGLSGDGDNSEVFLWQPDRSGDHQLFVSLQDADGEAYSLQVPTRIQ